MPYSLGLDLGTTTITAAVGSRSRVTVIATGARSIATPALVVATGRRRVTGHAAEVRSIGNADRTATAVLDSLGDATPVVINGQEYPADELLRTILDDVIAGIAAQQHEQPHQLTVTHPTHWSPRRVAMLRDAVGPLAPHGQLQLVANAAAVAADHATTHRLADGAAVAVCDLGATSFEVSVIGRRGDRLVLLSPRVKHGGFGGDQFDQALMNIADRQLAGNTARLRAKAFQTKLVLARLRRDCRAAKHNLSTDETATFTAHLPSGPVTVSLTRTGFEDAIRPLVDSVAESVRTSIADADATVPDAVVLTGGSSQIPLVQELVREAIGDIPVQTTRYGAARGAALLGMPPAATDAPPHHGNDPYGEGVEQRTAGSIRRVPRPHPFPA